MEMLPSNPLNLSDATEPTPLTFVLRLKPWRDTKKSLEIPELLNQDACVLEMLARPTVILIHSELIKGTYTWTTYISYIQL